MSDDDNLKRVTKLIQNFVSSDEIEIIASLLIKLQMDYTDLARLATDDQYDPSTWTHKDVLDFLTKGS